MQNKNTTQSNKKQSKKTFPRLSAQEITHIKKIKYHKNLTFEQIYKFMGFESLQNAAVNFERWLNGGSITRPKREAIRQFIAHYLPQCPPENTPDLLELPAQNPAAGPVKINVGSVQLVFKSLSNAQEIKAAAAAISAMEAATC